MIDTELLASIAQQMMSSNTVDVHGQHVPVSVVRIVNQFIQAIAQAEGFRLRALYLGGDPNPAM